MEEHKYRSLTFGTWNVRGLTEKKREVLAEVRRENEDVVVLTETKLRNVGEEDLEGYLHLYSGISSGPARAGVSILLKKQLVNNLTWKSINERLIIAEFTICGRTIVVVGVYWLDDCVKLAMKEAFEESFRKTVETVNEKHDLVILGDFNSRVGVDQNSSVVGKYGEPEVSKNGQRLVKLCKALNLKIQNTFFSHEDKHKFTWYHSRQSLRTLIDFCITRQDPPFLVNDVRACRWLECNTDHLFLEAILSFEIHNVGELDSEQEKSISVIKYRTYLLHSKKIRNSYKDCLNSKIDLSACQTTNGMYQSLKDSIHTTASFVLGTETKDNSGEFLWDQEVRDLQQRYRNHSEPNKLYFGMYITESQFQTLKNEILEGICSEIDSTRKCRKNTTVWDNINDIQNKPPNIFKEHFLESSFKHSTELLFNDNELRFSDKELSEILSNINIHDVNTILKDLDDSKGQIPGGLTIQLLKHSSSKSKILLTKLINKIFNGEEIPKEISEVYCIKNGFSRQNFIQYPEYSWHSIMRVMRVIANNTLNKYSEVKDFYKDISIESYSDATFIFRQILQKTVEKQIPPFHFALIDLKNLLSEVDSSKIFDCLSKLKVSSKLISIIKHLYEGINFRMVDSGRPSIDFSFVKDLGNDGLSCTLFKMLAKNALKAWFEENENYGVMIGNKRLLFILLKDLNSVIVTETNMKMRSVIKSLKLHLRSNNLSLNLKSIQYLSRENIDIDGLVIKGTEIVNLRSSVLEYDGRNVEEIFRRVLDTREAIGTLHSVARDKMISKKNKKKIFKSIIRNLLVQGCETWTITQDLKRLLEDTELNYWKWCCENYPKIYSRQEIYDIMSVKDTVSRIIMLKKAACYTHIMESDKNSWVRYVMEWEPKGVMKSGRPRKKWADGLEDFLKSFGNYQMYFQKKKVRKHNLLTSYGGDGVYGEKEENEETVF